MFNFSIDAIDLTVTPAVLLALSLSFHQSSIGAEADERYTPPHNEFDQPDIQGIWNYSSDVPLERPEEFIDKEYLTADESSRRASKREEGLEQLNEVGVGYHDKLWLDYEAHAENLRSSLITYPTNGKLPPLVNGIEKVLGGFLEDAVGTHPVR